VCKKFDRVVLKVVVVRNLWVLNDYFQDWFANGVFEL
jgi:hypothetical protein